MFYLGVSVVTIQDCGVALNEFVHEGHHPGRLAAGEGIPHLIRKNWNSKTEIKHELEHNQSSQTKTRHDKRHRSRTG